MFLGSLSFESTKLQQQNNSNSQKIFNIHKINKPNTLSIPNSALFDQSDHYISFDDTGDLFFLFDDEFLKENFSNEVTDAKANDVDFILRDRLLRDTSNSSNNHSNTNLNQLHTISDDIRDINEVNQKFKRPSFLIKKKERKKYTRRNRPINQLQYKCEHSKCTSHFNTIRKRARHHIKMNSECSQDTISLIKLIAETKRVLYYTNNILNKNQDSSAKLIPIKQKYKKVMETIAHDDYFQCIAGKEFDDCLTDDDDNENDIVMDSCANDERVVNNEY